MNNKSNSLKNRDSDAGVRRLKDVDSLLKRSCDASKYVRSEERATEGMVRLNKKIHFVNHHLFELYRKDKVTPMANREVDFFETKRALYDPKVNAERRCRLDLVMRLANAYDILLKGTGNLDTITYKRVYHKVLNRIKETSKESCKKDIDQEIFKQDIRTAVKALYVQGRLRHQVKKYIKIRKHIKKTGIKGFVHTYVNEYDEIRSIRLSDKLAGALVRDFEVDGWEVDRGKGTLREKQKKWEEDSEKFGKAGSKKQRTGRKYKDCGKHKKHLMSYSKMLRELMETLKNNQMEAKAGSVEAGDHIAEEEEIEVDVEENKGEEQVDFNEEEDHFHDIHFAGGEEEISINDSEMGEEVVVKPEENSEEEEQENVEEESSDGGGETKDDGKRKKKRRWKKLFAQIQEEEILQLQANTLRMGDIFSTWPNLEFPFAGQVLYDRKGHGMPAEQVLAGKKCFLVLFARLADIYSHHVALLDHYFKRSSYLREKVGLLTVCLDSDTLEMAVMMTLRPAHSWYTLLRSHLACSLFLRCRPGLVPSCQALDRASRPTSQRVLSDLQALGPTSVVAKWSGLPHILPASDLLGFALPGIADLGGSFIHFEQEGEEKKAPRHIEWEHLLDQHTEFQPQLFAN